MARRWWWPSILIAGGMGGAGKPVGEHRSGVGARFEGSGEDEGSPGDRSMAVHLGGGETAVRGSSGGCRRGSWVCRVPWCDDGFWGDRRAPVPLPASAVPREVLVAKEGGGGELAGGASAVNSPRGQKHRLNDDAGHTRTAATGLNR
jgi:hypothetical protein